MLRLVPAAIEPDRWVLAFHTTSPFWWVRALAFGRYKHVSAFAFVPVLQVWVVYDITLKGTRLVLLPDGDTACRWIAEHTLDADLVTVPRSTERRRSFFAPFFCVPAIRHLVGIPGGALRPDALHRQCLAHGGEPYGVRRRGIAGTGADPQPGNPAAGSERPAGPHQGDPGRALV